MAATPQKVRFGVWRSGINSDPMIIRTQKVCAIIPARNEALAIYQVVSDLRVLRSSNGAALIDRVIVCDNGSNDLTSALALSAGAEVVFEPTPGYGRACLKAISYTHENDILLFVDGDRSLYPEQAKILLDSISNGADLVMGARVLGRIEAGALTLPQRFGNRLAVTLIHILWRHKFHDLGPFRAITRRAYDALNMQDQTYGWTVEMQVKALRLGMRIEEYPVDSRVRLGQSKISGTVRGVIGAGVGIIGMIARLWWRERSIKPTRAELHKRA